MATFLLKTDANNNVSQIVNLGAPQDVDGTAASASSQPLEGTVVRIVSLDKLLRVRAGKAPQTAETGDIAIAANGELWLPINSGDVVAILGGKANISVAGE